MCVQQAASCVLPLKALKAFTITVIGTSVIHRMRMNFTSMNAIHVSKIQPNRDTKILHMTIQQQQIRQKTSCKFTNEDSIKVVLIKLSVILGLFIIF